MNKMDAQTVAFKPSISFPGGISTHQLKEKFFAAIEEGDETTVAYFLQRGFDGMMYHDTRGPALNVAVQANKLKIAELIFQSKWAAVIQTVDEKLAGALGVAVANCAGDKGSIDMVNLLLEHGAAVEKQPIYVAARAQNRELTALLIRHCQPKTVVRVLAVAIRFSDAAMVGFLLDQGVAVITEDSVKALLLTPSSKSEAVTALLKNYIDYRKED
jgi:hypothetical protein